MASTRKVASSRVCSPTLRKEYIHIDSFSKGNSNSNTLSLERMRQVPLFSPGDPDGLAEHACNCFMTRSVSSAGQSLGLAKQSGGVLVGPFYSVGHSTGQVCDLLAPTSRSWANRYPGLHLLRQRVASSSKPKCFVHSPSSRPPPVPLRRTYAEVLKSTVLSGEMAKECAEVDGWRVMDRRRQHVRGRSSGCGIGSLRGHANWEAHGRGTWRGRGGWFFASGSSLGLDARVAVDLSSGVQPEAAKKRVADVASGVTDMGKKRREELCCEICVDNHVPEEYPIYNGPKPHAALCGFAGGKSGFFKFQLGEQRGYYQGRMVSRPS
jgi:hypothetical protein